MSPLLFVFETVCKDGIIFCEDLESYPEFLESDWYAFWQSRGEDIVNNSWLERYSEYVVKEGAVNEEEVPDIEPLKENERDLMNSQEPVNSDSSKQQLVQENSDVANNQAKVLQEENNAYASSQSDEKCFIPENSNAQENQVNTVDEENNSSAQTWQDVWDDHYLTIYQKTYKLYETVHYKQYCFFRPTLIENTEEPLAEETGYEADFENQAAELKALGLPTSFAGRSHKYYSSALTDEDSETSAEEEIEMAPVQKQPEKPQPKRKKKRKLNKKMPKAIQEDKLLRKYWLKRFTLFSRFDEGIQLDAESWFSVTPEKVAIHMAERLRCDTIIDGFCGSGGNAIQFASTCSKVIAIDIDPEKIKNARHNAKIYGVANKIDFIVGDFLQLCSSLKGDVVFLSPPWGGPKYMSVKEYDIDESLKPLGATALAEKCRQISENIAFFLPKNSNTKQIMKLAGVGKRVEIEQNFLGARFVGVTAIYGDWLIDKKNMCK